MILSQETLCYRFIVCLFGISMMCSHTFCSRKLWNGVHKVISAWCSYRRIRGCLHFFHVTCRSLFLLLFDNLIVPPDILTWLHHNVFLSIISNILNHLLALLRRVRLGRKSWNKSLRMIPRIMIILNDWFELIFSSRSNMYQAKKNHF